MSPCWPMTPLGDVLDYRKEFIVIDDLETYRRPRVQLHAQGIILRDYVPGALIKTKKQQVIRAGELLVAEIDAKVGGFGIVPSELDGAIVSSHYFLYRNRPAKLDNRFLGWLVKTRAFRDQVEAQGSTNYAAIRPYDVLRYQIPLPSLDEQRRIVARIDALAAKIAEAKVLRNEAAESAGRLLSASIGLIERKYEKSYGTLSQGLQSCKNGLSRRPSGEEDGPIVLRLADVAEGKVSLATPRRGSLSEEEKLSYSLRSDDLLVVRVNGSRSIVGRFVQVPGAHENLCFNDHLIRVRVNREVFVPQFVAAMSRGGRARRHIEESAITTAGQFTINQTMLSDMPLPLIPLNEQLAVVASITAIQDRLDQVKITQEITAAELDAMLQSILNKAFSGDL